MRRMHTYLEEETYKYLKAESRRTGKSMSRIVRERLKTEVNQSKENLINAINEVAGLWQYKTESVEETIRNIRKGNRIGNI
ncbi:MAG: hypothetical protein GXO45_05590 [Aquificae bacterium]|nr:hypothetical protein [Aquificota bacterium]